MDLFRQTNAIVNDFASSLIGAFVPWSGRSAACSGGTWGWGRFGIPSMGVTKDDRALSCSRDGFRSGTAFVRIGGLSGGLAVAMGAYGNHVLQPSKTAPDLKKVFSVGNQVHLINSVALLAVPLTRRPYLVGVLLCLGILLFSGSCYYHALTGKTWIRQVTPYGGILLISAWLAMAI